jgi:hypothetical protein
MLLRSSSILYRVLLGMLLLVDADALAQPSTAGSAVGADKVETILTQQGPWTVYWSRLGAAPRPPASAASGTIQFSRRGDKLMGHMSIPVFGQECDFEVTVKDNGFIYPGCARFDKELIYDPADNEFPFKGAATSYWYWFRRQ